MVSPNTQSTLLDPSVTFTSGLWSRVTYITGALRDKDTDGLEQPVIRCVGLIVLVNRG
jgi:hypothetical protein